MEYRKLKAGIITNEYVKAPTKNLYKSEYEYNKDLRIFLDHLKKRKNYFLFD
jgi:hypothetical protein